MIIFSSIKARIAFFAFLLILASTLAFYLVAVNITNRHIMDEVVKRAEALSGSIAGAAAYSFSSKDLLGLDNIVFRGKKSNQDIEYIAIVDREGSTVVHSDIEKVDEELHPDEGTTIIEQPDGTVIREIRGMSGPVLEVTKPILFLDRRLGKVVVGVNKSALLNAQASARRSALLVFLSIAFVGIIGSLVLSSFLTRPIKELTSGVDEMIEGRLRPLKIFSRDELGRLTENFNEMTTTIAAQRERLDEFTFELEESYVSMVKVLAATIDARDSYTHGHSQRVSTFSLKIAREMGLAEEEIHDLEVACLFHDVGKLRTPDSILRKEESLNSAEHREMMRHVEYGADILGKAPSLYKYIPSVRHHHEWYNGKGYPDGLTGKDIPPFAAIIAVADAYDAMTTDRPYRKALTHEEAKGELSAFSGKQFDPHVIEHFMKIPDAPAVRSGGEGA
jgi:putative nucleotidyltransferase with HDIG domain